MSPVRISRSHQYVCKSWKGSGYHWSDWHVGHRFLQQLLSRPRFTKTSSSSTVSLSPVLLLRAIRGQTAGIDPAANTSEEHREASEAADPPVRRQANGHKARSRKQRFRRLGNHGGSGRCRSHPGLRVPQLQQHTSPTRSMEPAICSVQSATP